MKQQVPFNSDFCLALERYLTLVFSKSEEKLIRSLWCDGVLIPENEILISKKSVNDTREIKTKVWIGVGTKNQVQFDLMLYFGKYSLRRYAKGNKLDDCIAALESERQIINIENALIELHLL